VPDVAGVLAHDVRERGCGEGARLAFSHP
jgi:hypothetical protein